MRLTIVQRVLASYRVPFFDQLERRLGESGGALSFVAGSPKPGEAIVDAAPSLTVAQVENRALPGSVWWQRGVVSAVRSTRPEVVVIEANPRLLSNFVLLVWCRVTQVPVVAWGAGKVDRPRTALLDRLSDLILRLQLSGCRGAIGYGEVAADIFARLGRRGLAVGIAPNSTLSVDGGVSPPLDRRSSCPTFLFVGRLVEQKRVDVLIKAAAILGKEGFEFRLVIVGDGPCAPALRERSRADAVEFMGYCEPNVAHELMTSAHALVLPGRGGLVVQEALACGLPVVVGPPTVAGDGTVHRLLEGSAAAVVAGDPTATALAEAMRRIVDVRTWPDRSLAAVDLAARHGGLHAMTDAFLDVVGKVR